MLTLKAAGLLDIDAGEIVRPGILRIENDRTRKPTGHETLVSGHTATELMQCLNGFSPWAD